MRLDPCSALAGHPIDEIEVLRVAFEDAPPEAVLEAVLDTFPDQVAMVSSFGAEAAVLLKMVADVDRDLPVLMIDSLLLFEETLDYQRTLSRHLGLRNVQIVRPSPDDLRRADPDDTLNARDPDACCEIRKVLPLDRALRRWPVSITGRKRFQSSTRTALQVIERDETRLKVNPLARWTAQDLRAYMDAHALPLHPLVAKGYRSIGCSPCTTPVRADEDDRAGRWRGLEKVECGIHFGADGRILRAAS